jgi:four helix bundle protein
MGTVGNSAGTGTRTTLFDHERLDVYRVAKEFLIVATGLIGRKMPRDLKEQFDRASSSILFNIAEGAGKMARADKQRSYEIARGSALESATQLEVMLIRGIITNSQYGEARALLIRIAQMLARMSAGPRAS